jgi:heme exporter protein C
MIRQVWWKIISVLLLLYTLIMGLLVPLNPGIIHVSPSSANTGDQLQLQVEGYNSFYSSEQGAIRAWLKLDDKNSLAATSVKVLNDRQLQLNFSIPAFLPVKDRVKDLTLILDNPKDGASVLPSAVFITQDSIDPVIGQKAWVNTPISNLSERKAFTFPFRNILGETIRNQYFHVPLWFAMIFLFLFSVIYSTRYLRTFDADNDRRALALTTTGVIFGILGLVTGALWAKNTWGAYWSWDIKQNMTAVALLIYFAYFILRGAFQDEEKRARLGAVYNIFAFVALIPLIFVIPRLVDSLHPGAGGNPAFGGDDLDNTMRMVFYPAGIGWTLFGFWIASIAYRTARLQAIAEEE